MGCIRYVSAAVLGVVALDAFSAWKYSTHTDRTTDVTTHFAYTVSTSERESLGQPVFMIRCAGSSLTAVVNWRAFIGGRAGELLRVQVDEQDVMYMQVGSSTDGFGTFLKNNSHDSRDYTLRELIDQIRKGTKVVAEVYDHRGTEHSAEFSLSGADQAVGQVVANCKGAPESTTE